MKSTKRMPSMEGRLQGLAATIVLAAACAILWLPFGFRLSGLIEEWDVLAHFAEHGTFFVVDSTTPLAAHRLRPFTVLPHAIAHWLTPNSFDAWNWLLIAAVFLKGWGASMVGHGITRSRRWGLVFGLLVILYPADTMQLAFRGLHINWSMALVLVGSAWLLRAQEARTPRRRLGIGVAASALLLISVLLYEVSLPMLLLPVLALIARDGVRKTLQAIRCGPGPLALWGAGALAYVAYVLLLPATTEQTYQGTLTAGHSVFQALLAALPKLFDPGLVRSIAGGWVDALAMLRAEFGGFGRFYVCLAAGALTAGLLTVAAADPRAPSSESATLKRVDAASLVRMGCIGLLLVALGYGPFLFSASHIAITQRTYLFAAIGGSLFALACLRGVALLGRPLASACVFALLTLGVSVQLFQFDHYVSIAERQRKILKAVVENFEGPQPGKALIVKDASGQLNHTWMLRDHLKLALTYFYGVRIKDVQICLGRNLAWQQLDALARPGTCVEQADRWVFSHAPPVSGPGMAPAEPESDRTVPKSDAIVLDMQSDGVIAAQTGVARHRNELANGASALSARYHQILADRGDRLSSRLFKPHSPESFLWDFGRWWNLDVPTRGSGWREAEWTGQFFTRTASAWKTQDPASLIFDLKPLAGAYVLEGRFEVVLNEAVRRSVALRLNGQPVEIQWLDSGSFRGSVPQAALRTGVNTLELAAAPDNTYYGLSVKLDRVALHPNAPKNSAP
ncbi:conserved membrane hypothetical protein [Burkholderiales bacterium 8X]|nr:conserved membrane hypothetical protein [Burkholderiales bacterium 8X]